MNEDKKLPKRTRSENNDSTSMCQVVSRVLHDLLSTAERQLLSQSGRTGPRTADSEWVMANITGHNDVTQPIWDVRRKRQQKYTSMSSSGNDSSTGGTGLMYPKSLPSLLTENGQDALFTEGYNSDGESPFLVQTIF